jgi:hypothetical protein
MAGKEMRMAHDCETSHRFWYVAHVPEIGIRHVQGWCFGVDALAAAVAAVLAIRERDPRAEFLSSGDVYVTHDTACACLPEEFRHY